MGRKNARGRTNISGARTTTNFSVDRMRRRVLLAGTALVTSLIVSTSAAEAQQAVFRPLAPFSVNINNANDCIFVGACAFINTIGPFANIDFTNSGDFLTFGPAAGSIVTITDLGGRITVNNSGKFATVGAGVAGISSVTLLGGAINITNTGDVATAGFGSASVFAATVFGGGITINNSGNLATAGGLSYGISAYTALAGAINITNTGDIATAGFNSYGIYALASGPGDITVTNSGGLSTAGFFATGISAEAGGPSSDISILNNGEITTRGLGADGILARTTANNSTIGISNTGDITTRGHFGYGVRAITLGRNSAVAITNSGTFDTSGNNAEGIYALTFGRNADISVTNTGEINTRGQDAEGLYLTTFGRDASINVNTSGTITTTGFAAEGVNAATYGRNAGISITNSGDILAKGALADGMYAYTSGLNSGITISNSGSTRAEGFRGYGITAVSVGPGSGITVNNSGELFGSSIGLFSYSATSTTVNNSGDISAGSGLAIDTNGASTSINNSGLITGFVDLTNRSDTFTNMAGGEFNASNTSRFRRGNDLFLNEAGATLRTANKFSSKEHTRFTGLERFQNQGLITMVDDKTGDSFTLSNTPGGTDLKFNGSGKSTLGVDTFLGGPGSKSDTLTVEGTTTGRTRLSVNNTNPGPGVLNREGIPVVFVDGNVNKSNFYLEKPIDAGFFEYDLVFVPTGSGRFELRSHTGGGSHILPHIITAAHETFHQSTETWFDQTTDLRAMLARGSVCDDIQHPQERIRCQDLYDIVPAVWARGGGTWLDLDDTGTTKANGRTYRYDLGRDLDIWQVESGIDFGKEAILSPDDILVFGVLGGAVESSLQYDAIARAFEISNLEAGAYATYLRGGFFLDTLFKAFFGTIEPTAAVEYPETLDMQTYGLRMDSGYRFGGLKDGPFVEPLGTVAVSWTHVDDFAHQGNSVDFDDDEQVRGRVGLRVGTSSLIWEGTTFEPFVTGSFWGLLSGEHSATLTSGGTDFVFTDTPDEVWGEVSGGVNFFNPEAQTAVFAKVDYIFADQTEGISARGGMRLTW